MMTLEEKREKNRVKNLLWRQNSREKYLQAAAKYRHKNPNKLAEYKLKVRYDITSEQYTELLVRQGGRCAICGQPESATHNFSNNTQKLAVDHCHVTGKVRGLLCQDCNRGIGMFHDDTKRMEDAIEYLRHHSSK